MFPLNVSSGGWESLPSYRLGMFAFLSLLVTQFGEGRERGEKKTHSLCAAGMPLKSCFGRFSFSDKCDTCGRCGRDAICSIFLFAGLLLIKRNCWQLAHLAMTHLFDESQVEDACCADVIPKMKAHFPVVKCRWWWRGMFSTQKKRIYLRKIEKERDESGFSLCKVPVVAERDVFHIKWKRISPL